MSKEEILQCRFVLTDDVEGKRNIDSSDGEIIFVVALQQDLDTAFEGGARLLTTLPILLRTLPRHR